MTLPLKSIIICWVILKKKVFRFHAPAYCSRSPRFACRAQHSTKETLVSINRTPVLDLVDYQYLTARPSLEMLLEDNDGQSRTVHIHKLVEEPLGLTLESSLMSCPKTCANHCMFCFIEQMPPGMRPSLYVRDDDWRLSLMAGNFVTLTNLPPQENGSHDRAPASPLYISVQTTNGELRKRCCTTSMPTASWNTFAALPTTT